MQATCINDKTTLQSKSVGTNSPFRAFVEGMLAYTVVTFMQAHEEFLELRYV